MSDTDTDSMDEYILYDPDGCDSDDGSPTMMPPPLYEVPGISAGINASNVEAHDHTEAAAVHAVANDDIIEEDADESSEDEDDDGRLEPGLAYQMTASAHLGHQMLYSDRQIYRLKGNGVSKKRYACRIRTCRAALYLENGVLTKAPRFIEHNHTEQQAVAKKLGFQDGFKKKCKEGEVNPSRLFDRLLEADPSAGRDCNYNRMKRHGCRLKNHISPNAPSTVDDVETAFKIEATLKKYGFTRNKVPRPFYVGTVVTTPSQSHPAPSHPTHEHPPNTNQSQSQTPKSHGFTVFKSPKIIEHMLGCVNRNFFVDGTFRVVPHGDFKQLLIVHWEHKGHIWPIIYALMTQKSEDAYVALFKYIERNICQLSPQSFMADFESGLRNTFLHVYPGVKLSGCWFHFKQAVRRKATKLPKFIAELRQDSAKYRLYNMFNALPLLPSGQIRIGFDLLVEQMSEMGSIRFAEFATYIQRQWMDNVRHDRLSVHGLRSRTNNAVESFNSRLRTAMPPSGNFYKFASILAEIENRSVHDFELVIDGTVNVFDEQERKFQKRTRVIRAAEEKLASLENDYTVMDFLKEVTHRYNNGVQEELPTDDLSGEENAPDVNDIEEVGELEAKCFVCRIAAPRVIVMPCRHLAICKECNTSRPPVYCPQCEAEVSACIELAD